jgi:predicted nucleic acid-binding protein
MDIVFLDANVLFSAAHKHDANFMKLWRMKRIRLVSSPYAVAEAERNLRTTEQRDRLRELLKSVAFAPAMVSKPLPRGVSKLLPRGVKLPEKDAPILLGAIAARATHLLTGDTNHFGHYYGKVVEGALILSPAAYFEMRSL